MSRDAVGAKTKLAIAEQTTYETPATTITRGVEITSESLASEIGNLVSKALRADRAVHKRVRGRFNAAGDINWEQNAEGLTLIYKHAFGHGITLAATDGGIRGQLASDTTANQTSLVLTNVVGSDTWDAKEGASITVVYNLSTGDLTSATVTYSAFNPTTNTLTVASGLPALSKGDFVFLTDTTNYSGIYTHYIEAYKELPTALTVEVYRDIAVFIYSGSKINTISENYPAGDMLTGSCNLLARREWSGDWLAADMNVGDNTVVLSDASEFPASGTISIGTEDDLPYSTIDYNTNTITLDTTVSEAHSINDPVWLSKPSNEYVYTNVDPFSGFEAAIYMDGAAQEVLSVSWTLNNNIYADKFPIGSRYRARAPEQNRTVEGTMNVEFDDMMLYSKFVRGDSARLEIRAVKEFGEIVSGTDVYYQKHIILPRIEFNGSTPTAGGPELITHDMPFTALYDDDNNKPEIIAIFVNGQSSI